MLNWRQQAQRVHKEALVFYFVFKHPRTRWYTKCVAACTAGYLFSPVQLIPELYPGHRIPRRLSGSIPGRKAGPSAHSAGRTY